MENTEMEKEKDDRLYTRPARNQKSISNNEPLERLRSSVEEVLA